MGTMQVGIRQAAIQGLGKALYTSTPAWVLVRELVQNSLDGGATSITISTKDGLLVKDNGTGFSDPQLFLDVGGSEKGEGAIGGFGIAKLAVICQPKWLVRSLFGTLRGEGGEITLTRDDGCPGTEVWVSEFDWWSVNEEVTLLLGLLQARATVILNDRVLFRLVEQEVYCEDRIIRQVPATGRGCIVVRMNGLPMFCRHLYKGQTTYIYDVATTEAPYSDDYPLTVSRDDLKGAEAIRFSRAQLHIGKLAEQEVAAERLRRANIEQRHDRRGLPYLSSTGGTLSSVRLLNPARAMVRAACEHAGVAMPEVGVTGDPSLKGAWMKEANALFVNTALLGNRHELLVVVAHEVAHIKHDWHGEGHSILMGQVLVALLDRRF